MEQIPDFVGSKVGKFVIRVPACDELARVLEFALSPAGKSAREMGKDELKKNLAQAQEKQGKN